MGLSKPNIEKMKAKRDVEGLIRALKHKDYLVGSEAAKALGEVGDVGAVEPLVQALSDDSETLREKAIGALIQIGQPALEPLIEALEDERSYEPFPSIRKLAAEALGMIGDKKGVEPLFEVLKDEYFWVRSKAAEALQKLGWKPKDEIERAYYLLGRGELGSLVDVGKPAVQPLIEVALKKDWDPDVRKRAAETLGKIGETAVGPLIEALNEEYCEEAACVRELVAKTLGQIGDAGGVRALIEALTNEHWLVRKEAATALGNIGDERAIEPLKGLLNYKDGDVREAASKAAKEAIKKIQNSGKGILTEDVIFFLGTDSVTTALSACTELDFVRRSGGNLITPRGIEIRYSAVEGGVIVTIIGSFSKQQIAQIEVLGKYEYEGVKEQKVTMSVDVLKTLSEKGIGARIYLLSKKDAEAIEKIERRS